MAGDRALEFALWLRNAGRRVQRSLGATGLTANVQLSSNQLLDVDSSLLAQQATGKWANPDRPKNPRISDESRFEGNFFGSITQ
jgi:hypothetical protein